MKSLNNNFARVTCMSCPSHCEVKPNASLRVSFCQEYCFCTWPEASRYFSLGIMEGLLKQQYHYLYLGCVFVDFSISYLRFFTDKKWLDYLYETKLKIVLVCDRHLRPLANYWYKHHKDIFLIIYQQDNLKSAGDKLKKRFIYQRDAFFHGLSLSTLEFDVLGALIAGEDCNHLARGRHLDIRAVYAAKRRAEKKMGADINTPCIISPTQIGRYI
ncbi:helix-turn-helix transcriptional regulator, partial [Salmonella enterica subsp. enterica serovar Heidelberg]|nr:helix-turn-helix transcriptional regulator [Salmonella enterica subsp. enterica serovar Heidelberg]EFN0737133.1 helix-turn-helix transcriptional regulator [Escherichia coli]EGP7374573.1 helix-turn-helix transcriptional regulator [Salmonella enterica subsp. enterica serovar Muenchen]EKV4538261.1 helix-turn-helix transcriptional regulator [Klebsiella pneumoniae]HBB8740897.1 helix-turn-helix transcriptional regulator [Salmonella enterica subsp. enterica serovar Paratyphi A]HCC0040661.1 helix-t